VHQHQNCASIKSGKLQTPQMISVNPDIVRFIIDKAQEFHAKEAVSIPEEPLSPADDWAMQVLADHIDDPSYAELVSTISDLEPDQQACLVALMWLGRGDYELNEWQNALEMAEERHVGPTADYLIAKPLLANYLQEGLLLHGYEQAD